MKNFLNFKILRIIILTIILGVVVSQTDLIEKIIHTSTAQAIGDLVFDWGVPADQPLFKILNMSPGETVEKTVIITNNANSSRPLSIKGIKTTETGNLAQKLNLIIKTNNNVLYGPKNLQEFFNDSLDSNGIPLTVINPGETATYVFLVSFDLQAGNDFQEKTIIFDIQIGLVSTLPNECQNIKFAKIIYGTQGNDRLRGGNGNDLIFGYEGNDTINSGNGNDCIIAGVGNDKANGGNGNDQIFGNEGNDILNGGNGNDLLDGGEDNDTANGGNGKNTCLAEKTKKCQP